MELIIDANILMSALISTKGKTFDLIFNDGIRLFAPEFLFEEIEKYKKEIIEKSGLTESEFNIILSLIASRIEIISKNDFLQHLKRATVICPDVNDSEYFALSLKLSCAIWSNDKKLKHQDIIKIYNTQEIIKIV